MEQLYKQGGFVEITKFVDSFVPGEIGFGKWEFLCERNRGKQKWGIFGKMVKTAFFKEKLAK
jgi:hypothetical protein